MSRNRLNSNTAGVWPGYVAAVAGLVQSLLFVSAVVAVVVYLMGIIGQSKQSARSQSAAALVQVAETKPGKTGMSKAEPLKTPEEKTVPVPKTMQAKDKDAKAGNGKPTELRLPDAIPGEKNTERGKELAQSLEGESKTAAQTRKEDWINAPEYETKGGMRSLALYYQKDQVNIDKATQQQVRQVIEQLKQSGAVRWRLIGHQEANEPLSSRQAFFRVQNLRNMLLDAGIKVDAIEQRILPADGKLHPDTQVVLVPLGEPVQTKGKGN